MAADTVRSGGRPPALLNHGGPWLFPARAPEGDWQNNTGGLTEIKAMFRTSLICVMVFC